MVNMSFVLIDKILRTRTLNRTDSMLPLCIVYYGTLYSCLEKKV